MSGTVFHLFAGWMLTSDLFDHVDDKDAVEVLVTAVRSAPASAAEMPDGSSGPFKASGIAEAVGAGRDGTGYDVGSLKYLGSFDHYPFGEEIERLLQDNGLKEQSHG